MSQEKGKGWLYGILCSNIVSICIWGIFFLMIQGAKYSSWFGLLQIHLDQAEMAILYALLWIVLILQIISIIGAIKERGWSIFVQEENETTM